MTRWRFAILCAVVWLLATLAGAGGVYVLMRPTTAVAGSAKDVPASDAAAPQGASVTGTTPGPGANGALGDGLPHENDPNDVNVPAATPGDHVASATAGASSAGTVNGEAHAQRAPGPIDVPSMASDLGPFSSRLRSIACEPLHGEQLSGDRPTWRCVVTLNGTTTLYPVRSNGPHDHLAIYSAPLFSSGYAFVYVAARVDKPAHFSATIDPKAAPYPATVVWTSRVIAEATDLAVRAETMTAQAASDTAAIDPVAVRNAQSWAQAGVR